MGFIYVKINQTVSRAVHSNSAGFPPDRGQKTNLPGVFAAGDCTGRPYQYTKAVGEGNVAAHSIVEYLAGDDLS